MLTRNSLLTYVVIFGLVDVVIPIPILGLILLSVILGRPRWFLSAVESVYGFRIDRS